MAVLVAPHLATTSSSGCIRPLDAASLATSDHTGTGGADFLDQLQQADADDLLPLLQGKMMAWWARVTLLASVHGRRGRAVARERRDAVRRIQHSAKGAIARRQYAKTRAKIIYLQRLRRGVNFERSGASQHAAATRLGAAAKRRGAAKRLQQQKRASVTVQAYARRRSAVAAKNAALGDRRAAIERLEAAMAEGGSQRSQLAPGGWSHEGITTQQLEAALEGLRAFPQLSPVAVAAVARGELLVRLRGALRAATTWDSSSAAWGAATWGGVAEVLEGSDAKGAAGEGCQEVADARVEFADIWLATHTHVRAALAKGRSAKVDGAEGTPYAWSHEWIDTAPLEVALAELLAFPGHVAFDDVHGTDASGATVSERGRMLAGQVTIPPTHGKPAFSRAQPAHRCDPIAT